MSASEVTRKRLAEVKSRQAEIQATKKQKQDEDEAKELEEWQKKDHAERVEREKEKLRLQLARENGVLGDDEDGEDDADDAEAQKVTSVIIKLVSEEQEALGGPLSIDYNMPRHRLMELVNVLRKNDAPVPYSFTVNGEDVTSSLEDLFASKEQEERARLLEGVIEVVYRPQAVFRVQAVTRCSATIPGHTAPILHVSFSPDSTRFASGGADNTVRIWDALTSTPLFVCKGHQGHILAQAWAPNGRLVASGSRDGELRLWDSANGKLVGKPLRGHTKWINCIAWEPIHLNPKCSRLATCSKDGEIRVWDLLRRRCELVLSGHSAGIKSIRWGGTGLLYTASQDRTIKVWDSKTGKLVRTLEGHAHWVNHLALNCDHALRTGAYDHRGVCPSSEEEIVQVARRRYEEALGPSKVELLVSASEDFTIILWDPINNKRAISRMVGHQQPVMCVCFSPDGRYISSCSLDKSVRLWDGRTGKFLKVTRNHVQAVYQVCWSADSRLLVSSSADSTIKVLDVSQVDKKMMISDLPGHADEVYACDWSPNGAQVVSGGKDQVIKVWSR